MKHYQKGEVIIVVMVIMMVVMWFGMGHMGMMGHNAGHAPEAEKSVPQDKADSKETTPAHIPEHWHEELLN